MQNQSSGDMIYALCMQSSINYANSGFNVVACMYRGVSRYVKYSLEVRVCGLVPWQVTFIVLIKCILRLTTEWTFLLLLSDHSCQKFVSYLHSLAAGVSRLLMWGKENSCSFEALNNDGVFSKHVFLAIPLNSL